MRGTARGHLRVVERLLSDCAGKTRWQFAGRIDIAEEHVGNRGAGFDSGAPRLENCGDVLGGPLQLRAACLRARQGLPACRWQLLPRAIFLAAGEAEMRAAGRLRLPSSWWVRQERESPHPLACRFNCLGDCLVVVGDGLIRGLLTPAKVTLLRSFHLRPRANRNPAHRAALSPRRSLSAVFSVITSFRLPVTVHAPSRSSGIVGHGSDQRDCLCLCAERQQRADALDRIILQQHHGLVCDLASSLAAFRRGRIGGPNGWHRDDRRVRAQTSRAGCAAQPRR